MLNKFILNLNIRAKNSPHCAGRGNHCISFPVCNICFWKGLTHWSYCQRDAEVQIRQQPPSPPSENTFSCNLIIEKITKNLTSKQPSFVLEAGVFFFSLYIGNEKIQIWIPFACDIFKVKLVWSKRIIYKRQVKFML